MLAMNVGQVDEVKLLDRLPSKKLGRGLDEAVAVDEVAEVDTVDVEADVDDLILEVDAVRVVEVLAVTVIWKVEVICSDTALFLNSSSVGCNTVHSPSPLTRTRVSINSCSASSDGGGLGSGVGVACGTPASGARCRSATAVGSASSSACSAKAIDENNTANAIALAHCARGLLRLDVASGAKTVVGGPSILNWRSPTAEKEVMIMHRCRRRTGHVERVYNITE